MFHSGKTPPAGRDRLCEPGYRLTIVPSDLQRSVIAAVRPAPEAINRDGDMSAVSARPAFFAERERIARTTEPLSIGT